MRNQLFAVGAVGALSSIASAQQAPYGDGAIQPSKNVLSYRQLATYTEFGDDPLGTRDDLADLRLETQLTYGLSGDLALQAKIPVVQRWWDEGGSSEDDLGLGDPSLALRWRFWQDDRTAVNTTRVALIAGAELPSGDSEFSSRSVDPFVGVAVSSIEDRWAWNASARFKLNTSSETDASRITPGDFADEALFTDASLLYRLSPEEWGSDTHVSMYATLELNGLFETGGDAEVMLAPGFLWEAREWVWEVSVQIPVAQDVQNRFERDWSVRGGVRFLF